MVKILFIKICKEPMNVDRFKNNGSGVYFEEVLEKIRDIRSSEKVFWRKILDLAIVITIFAIRRKIYNKIEKNWILEISPSYLDSPANTVYLYEDSYIITNCFTTSKWQNIVHKRGPLTNKVNDNLIPKIKQEAKKKLEKGEVALLFSVTLNSGEKLTLTAETESINEIIDMINYDGIWYAQDY